MRLSQDQVKKVAKLASLPVTEQELETYSDQLSKILEYIEQLNQVNTDGVEAVYNVSEKNTVLAEDTVRPSLSQEQAIQNGPKVRNGYFVTKGVFQEE